MIHNIMNYLFLSSRILFKWEVPKSCRLAERIWPTSSFLRVAIPAIHKVFSSLISDIDLMNSLQLRIPIWFLFQSRPMWHTFFDTLIHHRFHWFLAYKCCILFDNTYWSLLWRWDKAPIWTIHNHWDLLTVHYTANLKAILHYRYKMINRIWGLKKR